jgi:hypothetical protein
VPKIPAGEQFGQVVAQPARFNETQMPRAAFGEGIANSMTAVAQDMIHEEQRERAARVAADKAMTIQRMNAAGLELRDTADDIVNRVTSGQLDKTAAEEEWKALSSERMMAALDGIPVEHQAVARGDMELKSRQFTRIVKRGVAARDREDTRAGLLSYLETQERFAVTNPEQAIQAAVTAIGELAPHAGMGPADIAKVSYGFRERVAANRAQDLIRRSSDSLEALDQASEQLQGEDYGDLTPEKRGQVENQILARKSYLQQREQTRIAREEAAAARRAREAEEAYKATQTIIDNGAIPSPEYLDLVTAKTTGTPYGDALRTLLKQSHERAGFASLSPQQQQAQLLELRARANTQGTTPELEASISTKEKIAAETKRQIDTDPLLYGVDRRLIDEVRPFDMSNLQALPSMLAQRTEQASTVSARLGRPVSPLLKSEADQLAQTLVILPVPQQRALIATISRSLEPRQAQALASQIAPKDDTLGLALFLTSNAQRAPRDPAELVLRGADALKAGRIKPASSDSLALDHHRQIAEQLSEVPWATTQARDAAISAAQKVYDGLRDTGKRSVREAISLATGGLAEWAGAKVPVPYGMTPREFRRSLETLDPKRVEEMAGAAQVQVGGQPMDVGALVKNINAVRLIPAGMGSYALESSGQLVLTTRGTPLRIKVD